MSLTKIFLFTVILTNLICVTRPLGGSNSETTDEHLCEFQENMTENNRKDLIERVSFGFKALRKEQERNKFFKSCISEGLICNGLRSNMHIAYDVNDEAFVKEIKKVQDLQSSRILDSFYQHSNHKLDKLNEYFLQLTESYKVYHKS